MSFTSCTPTLEYLHSVHGLVNVVEKIKQIPIRYFNYYKYPLNMAKYDKYPFNMAKLSKYPLNMAK